MAFLDEEQVGGADATDKSTGTAPSRADEASVADDRDGERA